MNDLTRVMRLRDYLFGTLIDHKAMLILEVMHRVLNRKPTKKDADDFEVKFDQAQRELLCYKGEIIGEIKLKYIPAEEVQLSDSFQWQFVGSNLL